MQASLIFFTESLGLRPINRPNNIGRAAAWLEIVLGQELHPIEVAGFELSPFEPEFGRHVVLAFPRRVQPPYLTDNCAANLRQPLVTARRCRAFSEPELKRAAQLSVKRRLVAHGATLIEPERATPFERFFFRDPNGYVFEVADAGRKRED